jgi:chorismate mutase
MDMSEKIELTDTDAPAAPAADPLEALRREIDAIDDAMIQLVEKRVSAAQKVAELKRHDKDSRLRLRPAREAAVIDRMVAQSTVSSERAVRHIWREIMASCLDLQVHTELWLHATRHPAELADAARRRFGCPSSMSLSDTPDHALEAARTREAIAVIEIGEGSDWWTSLADEPAVAAFDVLRTGDGKPVGIAVARIHADDLRACPQIRISRDGAGGELLAVADGLRLVVLSEPGR